MGWVVYGALMFSGVVSLAMQSAVYYRPLPDYTSTDGEVGMTKIREIAIFPLTLKVTQFMVISGYVRSHGYPVIREKLHRD